MRTFARVATVFLLAVITLAINAGDIVDPWNSYGTFGFTTDTAGVVTSVDPYVAALGLHNGDRADVSKMTTADRIFLGSNNPALPGRHLVLPLVSGKRIALVSQPRVRSFADNLTDIAAVLVLVTYTVLAALLVLLRPTPATWAFFLFSLGFLLNGSFDFQYFSTPAYVFAGVFISVCLALSPFAFFSFAVRFPNALPSGRVGIVEQALLAVAPAVALWFAFSQNAIFFGHAVAQWQTNIAVGVIAALYVPGIAILIARYSSSADEERARLQWVVAAFAVAFIPLIVNDALQYSQGFVPSIWLGNSAQVWLILAPAALAYTVLKHRLFDIRLVVSRALIFGVLTTLTVGVLALADWALGKWLEASRFALVAEVALAVVIGFSLTNVHGRIERLLNGFIFRAQTAALAAVRRFIHEVDLIADPRDLVAQTYETLRRRIECEYVAIHTAEGGTFVRTAPASGDLPAIYSANDLAVLRLRRWNDAFECDVPGHPLYGALLLPMTARTQLVGFIACGPKADRTHYLPAEVATLESLAHRAGAGYAWLTLRALGSDPVPLA